MIVVDTSAIFAILYREPFAEACGAALKSDAHLAISAGTLAEAHLVAARSEFASILEEFLERLELEVVPVTAETAVSVGRACAKWGKGQSPAKLNFGDCFAYVLAKSRNCPLLFVGNDFAQTDAIPALR